MTKVLNLFLFFFFFSFPYYITHQTMVKASSSEAGVFVTVTGIALNKIPFWAHSPPSPAGPSIQRVMGRVTWGPVSAQILPLQATETCSLR